MRAAVIGATTTLSDISPLYWDLAQTDFNERELVGVYSKSSRAIQEFSLITGKTKLASVRRRGCAGEVMSIPIIVH